MDLGNKLQNHLHGTVLGDTFTSRKDQKWFPDWLNAENVSLQNLVVLSWIVLTPRRNSNGCSK